MLSSAHGCVTWYIYSIAAWNEVKSNQPTDFESNKDERKSRVMEIMPGLSEYI